MLGFSTTGKRSPRAASGAWAAWLMTRAAGKGSPSCSSNDSCSALDVSVTQAS